MGRLPHHDHAAGTTNWHAGGIQAPIARLTLSNENPQPSPCFAMLRLGTKGIVYDKAITRPTLSIWNCNPKNVVQLTAQQQQLNSLGAWCLRGGTKCKLRSADVLSPRE
jgi:hypothetical protein